jgi:hypothetical protein
MYQTLADKEARTKQARKNVGTEAAKLVGYINRLEGTTQEEKEFSTFSIGRILGLVMDLEQYARDEAEASTKADVAAVKNAMSNVAYDLDIIHTTIYKDVDDNGSTYTVYSGSECLGNFLGDDPLIVDLVKRGVTICEGIDNRS